jgi:choline kinase
MKYVILANSNNTVLGIPRQLVEVNGEPLVVRTIRLLKENGVYDILITAQDERFYNLGAEVYNPVSSDYDYATGSGYWLNAFPFELLNEPVCFIWGDVYFSEDAIKTIVEKETDSTLFFCAFENHHPKYIKKWDEPLAYKVVDTELFKRCITETKRLKDEKVCWREPIVWELYRVIHNQNVNVHNMTVDYIAINDESCDIDDENDLKMIKEMVER